MLFRKLKEKRLNEHLKKFIISLSTDLFTCEENYCSLVGRGEKSLIYQHEDNNNFCICKRNEKKIVEVAYLIKTDEEEIRKKLSNRSKKIAKEILEKFHLSQGEIINEDSAPFNVIYFLKEKEAETESLCFVEERMSSFIEKITSDPQISIQYTKILKEWVEEGKYKKADAVQSFEELRKKLREIPAYKNFFDEILKDATKKVKEILERKEYLICPNFRLVEDLPLIITYTPERNKMFKEIVRKGMLMT